MTFKKASNTHSFSSKVRNISRSPQNTVGGFLSKVFVDVLEKRTRTDLDRYADQRTFLERWNALVVNYLTDPKNSIPQNKEALTAARGNLIKEILKTSMTWKVWVKAMRLLQVVKIDFHFRFTLFNNEVIEHQATMNLGQVYVDDEQDLSFNDPAKSTEQEQNKDSKANIEEVIEDYYVQPVPKSTIPEDILG